jgi:hypothetical protein
MNALAIVFLASFFFGAGFSEAKWDPADFEKQVNNSLIEKTLGKGEHLEHLTDDQAIEVAQTLSKTLRQAGFSEEEALKKAYSAVEKHPAVKNTCDFSKEWPEFQSYEKEKQGSTTSGSTTSGSTTSGSTTSGSTTSGSTTSGNTTSGNPTSASSSASAPSKARESCEPGKILVEDLQTDLEKRLAALTPTPPNTPPVPPSKPDAPKNEPPILGRSLPEEPSIVHVSPTVNHHRPSAQEGENEESTSIERPSNQNVEIFRQALEEKVQHREIEPALAQAILDHFAPSLERETDLSLALEKGAQRLRPSDAHEITTNQLAPLSPSQFVVEMNSKQNTGETSKSILNNPTRESFARVPEEKIIVPTLSWPVSSFLPKQGWMASSSDLPASKPSSKNILEKNSQRAVIQKYLPGTGKENPFGTPYKEMSFSSSPALSAASLLAGKSSTAQKKENLPEKKIPTSISRFIEQVASFFRPKSIAGAALRGLATSDAATEPFANETLVPTPPSSPTLASLESPLSSTIEENPWPMGVAFLGSFSAALIAFALWLRWKADRERKKSS